MIGKIKRVIRRLIDRHPIIKVQVAELAHSNLLKNKCALITGGTSGIGFAIAAAYLKAGCNIIITGRSQNRIDEAKKKLSVIDNKLSIIGVKLDNTQVDTFEEIFIEILKKVEEKGISCVDILVNNA